MPTSSRPEAPVRSSGRCRSSCRSTCRSARSHRARLPTTSSGGAWGRPKTAAAPRSTGPRRSSRSSGRRTPRAPSRAARQAPGRARRPRRPAGARESSPPLPAAATAAASWARSRAASSRPARPSPADRSFSRTRCRSAPSERPEAAARSPSSAARRPSSTLSTWRKWLRRIAPAREPARSRSWQLSIDAAASAADEAKSSAVSVAVLGGQLTLSTASWSNDEWSCCGSASSLASSIAGHGSMPASEAPAKA
mmetsp:Transcript_68557/g.214340  ORF Transcript_68557/g.214340 Transcript_68557/m.214340 type:complete len:252 (+) Transcript_68557:551-1306(+)